jgi:phosphoribosylformylglycinamidine (FGAM) synthase-like amidotransferase family enzyme
MPHPDRAADARLGSADGLKIFRSMMETIAAGRAAAA